MVETPKVAVLFGFGINCDRETAAVFDIAGGKSERVHVNRFVNGERDLSEFHILAVPGGFSFGDHLGSGRLLGNRMRFAMREQLTQFVADGKPIIGICNGFQVLVKTGLLPGKEVPDFEQSASLTLNNSGRYEDRGVNRDNIKTPVANHPLIRTHPITGKKAIYVNRTFTTGIEGMNKNESSSILEFLFEHCEHVNFQIRYRWNKNDMAFWDNRCTMHRAIWDYWPNERKGRRVTIKGDKPV